MPSMKVSDLGEFGLIDLIRNSIARHDGPEQALWRGVLVGIGDDAAAWRGDDTIHLATTDTLVQDVHFDLGVIQWDELGWKALAVNLSDIAAMGGVPRYALLSLALPGDVEIADVSRFSDEMVHLAREFGVAIVGGNTATAPNVVVTMTVIGYCKGDSMLRRSTATPGQQIAVTGSLGASAAGLAMLKDKTMLDSEVAQYLRRAHLKPMPRVREGQTLIEQGVRTAIDVSDGLIADLDHICEASRVNARIRLEHVPVHAMVAANFANYRELALCGGEDYELVFTALEGTVKRAQQALDCPVTIIGEITGESSDARVTVLNGEGNVMPYERAGWGHFKDGRSRTSFA